MECRVVIIKKKNKDGGLESQAREAMGVEQPGIIRKLLSKTDRESKRERERV